MDIYWLNGKLFAINKKARSRFIFNMFDNLIIAITITFYIAAIGILVYEVRSTKNNEFTGTKMRVFCAIAVLFHSITVIQTNNYFHSIDISVSAMSVSISGLIAALFLAGTFFYPIKRLGLIVIPAIIMTLIFALLWDSNSKLIDNQNSLFAAHMVVSITSYALLALATLQAILFSIQEKLIRQKSNNKLLMALAPLETMENILFKLAGIGFLFLTLTLISGIFFSQAVFGQAFVFKHHVVLTILGWLAFAILLFGRLKNGWRGKQAVIWTIAGFVMIQLGYFGTKMVLEVLHH